MSNVNKQRYYCNLPTVIEREEELKNSNISQVSRSRSIIVHSQKWVNNSVLTYYFFEKDSDKQQIIMEDGSKKYIPWKGSEAQKTQVRKAFDAWKNIGINLEFKEVLDRKDAMIRIGFMLGDGSWSYVGTDSTRFISNKNKRTMNFGWDIADDFDTALHEVGHCLALKHEHQNPKAGITWNEEAVYKYFAGKPNYWKKEITFQNIIKKITANELDDVQNSEWDANSCMHYAFDENLVKNPEKYKKNGIHPAGGLSSRDRKWIKKYYPLPKNRSQGMPTLEVLQPSILNISNGEQVSYRIVNDESREYDIQLSGESDAVIVLFEQQQDGWKQIDAKDDSGQDKNANIRINLDMHKEYMLSVRLYWSGREGRTVLLMW